MPNISNHQPRKLAFNNLYYAMRHGQSEANVSGIIVSDPATGCNHYGLSKTGRQQVHDAIKMAGFKADTYIISSDFLRTKETAEIVQRVIQSHHGIQHSPLLRERFFGELNGQNDKFYQKVWTLDRLNPNHQAFGVESANHVVTRVSGVIESLEETLAGESILLVAHGDVLQLLQTWFQQVPATQHRELKHLGTAEVRCLNPTNN
jgi:probable phosphoglycerate mutase